MNKFAENDRYIEITGVDLDLFVKECYNLSKPQGMGFLHWTPGPLPQDIVDEILSREKLDSVLRYYMDYVLGRAVKMGIFEQDGRLFIISDWFDHSENHLRELLHRVGISYEPADKSRPEATAD